MEYTVVIGNAIAVFNKEKFPVLEAYWEVDNSNFIGRIPFPTENVPPYFSLGGFSEDVGLRDMFHFMETSISYSTNSTRKNPMGIRKEDADYVTEMLNDFKARPEYYKNSNGCLYKWRIDNNYDYNLEVLTWLENQMQFAVKNFDTPAIQVYE